MREFANKIDKILRDNGFVQSVVPKEGGIAEMAEYVKNYYDNVMGIEIALEPCSLDCYGYYGVGCVQIVKYENDAPYIRDDIRRMQELIFETEKELVKLKVPFRPTYGFGKNTECYLGKNLDLREEYKLTKYEKERR